MLAKRAQTDKAESADLFNVNFILRILLSWGIGLCVVRAKGHISHQA